jgi:hypothetical protein
MSTNQARSRPPRAQRFAIEVLDVETLRDRAGRDEPYVVEQIEDFLCLGVGMPELFDAIEARDFKQLQTLAHLLRGSLVALAANTAASAAGEVELRAGTLAIARGEPDGREASALSDAVLELCERFDDAVDAMRCVMDDATTLTPRVPAR